MEAYYNNFIIFDTTESESIDFDQVGETSIHTLRLNYSQSQTFVKYSGSMPTSVSSLSTKEGPYTYEEMLNILSGSAWNWSGSWPQ